MTFQITDNAIRTTARGNTYTVRQQGGAYWVSVEGAGNASRLGSLRRFDSLEAVAAKYKALRNIAEVAA